ncbi:hypothetical protein DKR79_22125, partial [Salmonella enterica subsp. arizonae serovar 13,23:gz51:-]|nr:hypothetical protein [Salmonella enterica subsp. arizonae serovar 13,23:gz51:-]
CCIELFGALSTKLMIINDNSLYFIDMKSWLYLFDNRQIHFLFLEEVLNSMNCKEREPIGSRSLRLMKSVRQKICLPGAG